MIKNNRLTIESEVCDMITLTFCESCGEDDCRDFCSPEGEETNCEECPVQKSFERLHEYELIGTVEEFAELVKVRTKK